MEYDQMQLIEKIIIKKIDKLKRIIENKEIKFILYKGDQYILMSGYGEIGLIPCTIIFQNRKIIDYITITTEEEFSYKHLYVDEWFKTIIDEEEEGIPDGYIYFIINDIEVYIPIIVMSEGFELPEGMTYKDYEMNPVDKERR